DGFTRLRVSLFKPRNDQRCLWFELPMGHIVVREGAVKRILSRHERDRNIVSARGRIGIIKTSIIGSPISVPGALVIWYRIVPASLFTNPKNRRHDIGFPQITSRCTRARSGWDEDLRFHLEQRLLA